MAWNELSSWLIEYKSLGESVTEFEKNKNQMKSNIQKALMVKATEERAKIAELSQASAIKRPKPPIGPAPRRPHSSSVIQVTSPVAADSQRFSAFASPLTSPKESATRSHSASVAHITSPVSGRSSFSAFRPNLPKGLASQPVQSIAEENLASPVKQKVPKPPTVKAPALPFSPSNKM
jgi:hypothetical protein